MSVRIIVQSVSCLLIVLILRDHITVHFAIMVIISMDLIAQVYNYLILLKKYYL